MLFSKEIKDAAGFKVFFWYLDVVILNKYYGNVISCLDELRNYPGVKRVNILPIVDRLDDFIHDNDKYDNLLKSLMKYVDMI
jgi:hypothetical protein